jgi:hypothetical protein
MYLAGTGVGTPPVKVMRITVEGASRDSFAAAQKLLDFFLFAEPGAGRYYDVSPKDDRLLVISNNPPEALRGENELAVVLNWTEELKRLVPTP